MNLWKTIGGLLSPEAIATPGQLSAFLESRAAYLVQKSMMEYLQARSNMLFSTLVGEPAFIAAHERARWRGYPHGFAIVAEVAEGFLREPSQGRAAAAIARIGGEVFARFPVPAGEPAEFWRAAEAALARHLAAAGLAAPRPANFAPLGHSRAIFEELPVHERVRRHDFEMFENTLRFHTAELAAEFEERAAILPLAQAL